MHRHGPSCLEGPLSRKSGKWRHAASVRDNSTMKDSAKPQAKDDRPIRKELVERVRREIAAGTYETPEKWALALEKLLKRLQDD
jgi:anti-sigma28 factor (negative regulator of flagellin synthesis)